MGRFKSNAILLIFALLLTIPSGLFSQSASWKEYSGKLFSASYPGEWFCLGGDITMLFFGKYEEEGKEYDGAVITPIEFDMEKPDPSILFQSGYIAIMMGTMDEDEKEDDEAFETVFKKMEPEVADAHRDEIEIDGHTFYTLKGTFKGAPMGVLVALSAIGDHSFLFTGMMPKENDSNMIAIMGEILESVSFPF